MKVKFACFKLSKTIIILNLIILLQVIFIVVGIIKIREEKNFEEIKDDVKNMENTVQIQEEKEETKNEITNTIKSLERESETKLEEYKNMPKELKGYKVIGKLEIPKIKLSSYILSETNTKSLKVSITKLYGPEVGKVGNLCIAGHNYRNNKMFGGIKKLEIGDEIILTDTFDRSIRYQVYDTYKTNPKDVSCLNQETGGDREITLITCTAGAIQRVIVKAIEIYD